MTVSGAATNSGGVEGPDDVELTVTDNESAPVVDTTAPSLSSATVDGYEVVLTYDEALDSTSVPSGDDFSWTWTDETFDYQPRVTAVSVSGTRVTLKLLDRPTLLPPASATSSRYHT